MSLTIQGDDFNAPTNPQLTSTSSDFSDGDRIYTAIVKHGGVSVSITGFGGTVTENSNLTNTKGFRIKCYDALTTTGVRFNPTDWNATTQKFTTNDYFVLLYSDSPFQHHFAKITEVKTEDLIGDAFEFEPKLGNEIPKDTKFIIFQVTQNTDIVALSLGMLQDDDAETEDELARRMSVARPLFYFYDGLDKKRELDHNTKYYAMRECGTANTYTLDNTDPSRAFVTVQDFGKTVIDYSKFTHRVKLTDKLRDLDAVGTATNEGLTGLNSGLTTDYNNSYRNARRITDDEINSPTYTGPIRYLHYDFSPTKSNVLYNIYDHVNTESIDGKGGFSETSIIDNARIIPKKIKEFSAYRVRHNIHRGDLNAFFQLKATYDSSTSAFVFSFETEYDLGTVLNTGDEVKLGDKILIVNSFGTLSGTTQTITFQNDTSDPYARGEDDGVFTAQAVSPSSGEVLHRRAYNANDGTLMLDTHLLNGRFSKMYVAFTSLNHNERFASVTACDATKNMITLSFDDDSYNSNPLSFTKGQYQLFIERFNGEIESITSKKESGQSVVDIKGRDKFNKLLSPVVNLNTLFSEDIIYSSSSPYNKLGNIKSGNTYTVALGATEIDTGIVAGVSFFDNYPVTGTRLFGANGYVGEVVALSLHASTNRKLIITPAITELNSEALYMDIEKNYVLSKSLGSSHLATNKATSLTGAANKGLIFTAGNEIKSITKSGITASSSATVTVADTSDLIVGMAVKGHLSIPTGSTIVSIDSATEITISANATSAFTQDILFFGGEGDSLVATSANTSEGAIGYAINSPSSISNDFSFQTLLKDEHGSAGISSFDTINTLMDFEVVNISQKENTTEIELAPYIPITLGRKISKYGNANENSNAVAVAITASRAGLDNNIIATNSSSTAWTNLEVGDAIYKLENGEYVFLGIFRDIMNVSTYSSKTVRLQMDRNVTYTNGITLYKIDQNLQELVFTNGQHLWGGKVLTIPHNALITSGTNKGIVPLNHENPHSSGKDIHSKFGQFYYKMNSLAIGNFSYFEALAGFSVFSSDTFYRNTYGDRNSKLNYFSEVYQIKPNIASSNITIRGKTNTTDKHWPYDERGQVDILGSVFRDTILHRNDISTRTRDVGVGGSSQNLIAKKNQIKNLDNSYHRLFMYINSDVLPYSSLREDSLFNGSKNIKNYGLLLIDNKNITDNALNDTESSQGNRKKLQDINFQQVTINSSDFLNSNKRFGMMRLTEMCFDFLFNPFNPERPLPKEVDTLSAVAPFVHKLYTSLNETIDATATTAFHSSGDTNKVVFSGAVNLANGVYLVDEEGNVIGAVDNPSSPTNSNMHVLSADVIYTNQATGGLATSTIYKEEDKGFYNPKTSQNAASLLTRRENTSKKHMGAIIPHYSRYGETQGEAFIQNGNSIVTSIIADNTELILPFSDVLDSSNPTETSTANTSDCRVFGGLIANISDNTYRGGFAVALDRYDIEDGGRFKLEKGMVSGLLTNLDAVIIGTEEFISVDSSLHFKDFEYAGDSSPITLAHSDTIPFVADGIMLGMKFRLWVDDSVTRFATNNQSCTTASNTTLTVADSSILKVGMVVSGTGIPTGTKISSITNSTTVVLDTAATDSATKTLTFTIQDATILSSNGNVYKNTMIVDGKNEFLKYVDLTGCYLVGEGTSETSPEYLNETLRNFPTYVISHEVDISNINHHIIITSNSLTDGVAYRIMQPNEVCMYDFTPEDITFNKLSSKYTKVHNEDKCYDIKSAYLYQDGKKEIQQDEGFLSMYVMVDTDNQTNDGNLVVSDSNDIYTNFLTEGSYPLFMSDGENNKKVVLTVRRTQNGIESSISETFFAKGIVSLSETFTIQTQNALDISPTRACIGTTVSVGLEGEDLINELLETEEIQFQTTGTDTPMYLAPNYQGVDLYSAINYILDRKDMKIVEENNVFKIAPEDENEYYTNITIDDSGDYLISEFEKQTTLFDFYNEIIVYGSSHKATRKDLRSINKRGRKTLEVVDGTLLTQEEVDKRATKLLRIHSRFNQKLSFTMQSKGINQLRVGDIVTVSIPRENIETGEFIVLEMEHQLTGFIKLQLGRYTKDLSDIFSELLIASKETKSALRSADLNYNEISFNFLDTLNTKELKLLVRKRGSTGAALGFTTPLGFGLPLGFGAGTITITDLVEEDLA